MRKPRTIDIIAHEWFDKANGNSYFSATVTTNYGMRSEKSFVCPFQYGYGDFYQTACFHKLTAEGLDTQGMACFIQYCHDKKIIFRATKHENCLKRELIKN